MLKNPLLTLYGRALLSSAVTVSPSSNTKVMDFSERAL
jgi:hypothetical protein